MMTGYQNLVAHLSELSPDLGATISEHHDDCVIEIPAEKLIECAQQLKTIGFDRLGMLTAVDLRDEFEMVYRLASRSLSAGAFVKTRLSRENAVVDSLCDIWPAANWQEREVWDLFGIRFEGHPDLRRILLPEEWPGHPLRKDYEDPNMIRRPDYI
jgi:NADH-quinone oxidoreductase subunit C